MGLPSVGTVVVVRFPFSDLSRSKLRPAIVLADAGRNDWIYARSRASLTLTQLRSKSQTPIYRQAHLGKTVTLDPVSFSQQTQGSSLNRSGN